MVNGSYLPGDGDPRDAHIHECPRRRSLAVYAAGGTVQIIARSLLRSAVIPVSLQRELKPGGDARSAFLYRLPH
jgi:hypothetical protein